MFLLLVNGEIQYVGEAKGSGGLRDRLLQKHISGDESHAKQRAMQNRFPDRMRRREYIRNNVAAKWVLIDDPHINTTGIRQQGVRSGSVPGRSLVPVDLH